MGAARGFANSDRTVLASAFTLEPYESKAPNRDCKILRGKKHREREEGADEEKRGNRQEGLNMSDEIHGHDRYVRRKQHNEELRKTTSPGKTQQPIRTQRWISVRFTTPSSGAIQSAMEVIIDHPCPNASA